MFGKPKKQNPPPEQASSQPAAPQGYSDVYVMPEKYIVQTAKKGGKGLLIAVFILLAVILLTASYFIYDFISGRQETETPEVIPPQIEAIESEAPAEPEIEATTTPETATTTAATVASTEATTTPAAASASQDSDNDGLSDIEETILGTLPSNPDTDGDGYKDGVEVAAGYNPTTPGSSKLKESPFIVSLATSFGADDFRLLYPKDWQASLVKAGKQVLLTAATGEIIRISVKDNQLGQSVLSWYLQDHPEALVSQLRVAEAGTVTGIYAPNGLTAYLTDSAKSKFYIFEYLVGAQTELRYQTIFNAILKSLTLIAPAATAPAAVPTSTAANSGCAGYLCVEEPCGQLVSGEDSCLSSALKSTCYEKACSLDSDCAAGQSCVEISCWSGDMAELAKICK